MEDSHPHDGHQAGRLHHGEEEVGGRLGLRDGAGITWGRRRGIGVAARVEERGGGGQRGGGVRGRGRLGLRGEN
jgi:hypothetical protein